MIKSASGYAISLLQNIPSRFRERSADASISWHWHLPTFQSNRQNTSEEQPPKSEVCYKFHFVHYQIRPGARVLQWIEIGWQKELDRTIQSDRSTTTSKNIIWIGLYIPYRQHVNVRRLDSRIDSSEAEDVAANDRQVVIVHIVTGTTRHGCLITIVISPWMWDQLDHTVSAIKKLIYKHIENYKFTVKTSPPSIACQAATEECRPRRDRIQSM